jgi:hypothetical protein
MNKNIKKGQQNSRRKQTIFVGYVIEKDVGGTVCTRKGQRQKKMRKTKNLQWHDAMTKETK